MKKMICFSIGAFFLSLYLSLAVNGADPRVMKSSPSTLSPTTQPSAIVEAMPAPNFQEALAPQYSETNNSVLINWAYPSGTEIDGFKIERKVGAGSYGIPVTISGSSTRFYQDNQLPVNSVLTYRMRAYRVVGGQEYYSPYSSEIKVTTKTVERAKRLKVK